VRVYVAHGELSEHVAEVVAEPLSKLGGDASRAGTGRAFEVAVLDQGEWRFDRSADVVHGDVDRRDEDRWQVGVCLAAQEGCPAEHEPPKAGGEEQREQHADGGLVTESLVVEGDVGDEEGEREADAR
jgi:hypothetical protein